jgi:hypothetical protein
MKKPKPGPYMARVEKARRLDPPCPRCGRRGVSGGDMRHGTVDGGECRP